MSESTEAATSASSDSKGQSSGGIKVSLGSIGSSLSKGFGITKQFVKQKIGKAESVPESKEFLAALERLHVATRNFNKLFKLTQSVFATFPKAENDGKGFLDNEIKYATKLEKDYRIARLDYDARTETLRDLISKKKNDKIPQAQKNADEATETYEKIKAELQKTINYIDEQKDRVHKDTIATCCELLQSLKPEWEAPTSDVLGEAPGEPSEIVTATPVTTTSTTAPTTTTTTTTTTADLDVADIS